MRITITGGNGQLGTALQDVLIGHDVTALGHTDTDVTDAKSILGFLTTTRPDVVVHAAAYTDVDGCARNPERAFAINANGTANVAFACRSVDAAMVHISTNEVFSGTRTRPYDEWSQPNPINAYGASKAAAEVMARDSLREIYVVRTAWLYGPQRRNFIHAILKRAREQGALQVVADEVANPTYVVDLARAISQLIETGRFGTYHFVNEGACSRWEFANEILKLAGLRDVQNRPILGSQYRRDSTPPPFASLRNNNGAALGICLRPWKDALGEFLAESESL